MKRPILLAIVSATACLPAVAQEDWSLWETDWKAEAGLVLSPGAEQPALYRLGFGVDTNRVLDNGLVLGLALQMLRGARASRRHLRIQVPVLSR